MCKCWSEANVNTTVYLFNSAFRETYSHNLFKIMALQNGQHARMRFAVNKNVPAELRNEEKFCHLIGKLCIIIFVDRYNHKNYEYIPIRKGTIIRINEESGYLFVDIKLDDFISIDSDVASFTGKLLSKLANKNIPQLKENDPKNSNDGNYIVESTESIMEDVVLNNDSWLSTVKYMNQTKALDEKFTFIKVKLNKANTALNNGLIIPDTDGILSISPNCKYALEITYFDPTLGNGNFSFNLGFQMPLVGMQSKIYCTSGVDNVWIPISSSKIISLGYKLSSLQISQVNNNIERSVLTIPIKIKPISRDVKAIGLIIIISALTFFTEWYRDTPGILLSLVLTIKWLMSLGFIVYAGMRIF